MQYPKGIRRTLHALFSAHYNQDPFMIATTLETLRALVPWSGIGEQIRKERAQ